MNSPQHRIVNKHRIIAKKKWTLDVGGKNDTDTYHKSIPGILIYI